MIADLATLDERICDAINALADIDVSWFDDIRAVDPEAIDNFRANAATLLKLIEERPDIVDAAKVISSSYGKSATYPVSSVPSSALAQYISVKEFNAFLETVVADLHDQQTRSPTEATLTSAADIFWDKESALLKQAGLNQGAIRVIMERSKNYEQQIIRNFLTGQYIRPSRWERSTLAARNQLSGNITVRYRPQYQRQTTLATLKDKIVGNAIIWANLIPLFYHVRIDWASTMSAIAGATAAAIVPSRSRD